MKKHLLLVIVIYFTTQASAQYYHTGQDPASIRWKQINTLTFQLIFPDYYEEQAKKLAGNLEVAYPYTSFTLKHNPAKIPVILHTQTVQSNGLVAWAPKRAEFFTTPHQSMYAQEWLEQLALHEFRHVVQVDKIQSNLPRWIRYSLGEQGTALAFGAYLPWWFIEGDAVVTETALSQYGRGRFPSFLMEHQAQVVEKGVFTYDKAFFGSYRDFVPNHYKLGYHLAGNLRARHGSELWEEVLTRAGSKPFSLMPLKQVLKQKTGLNVEDSYQSVFDSLQGVWLNADRQYASIPFETITGGKRFFTNYNHNHWLNDSVLISYKTGYDVIPSFVKINISQGTEEKIVSPGTVFGESVGFRNEWLIWSEQIRDIRWHHSGRSLLRAVNVNTGRRIDFQPEFKSLSPAISPDNLKVAVVETDFSNNHYISVYLLHEGSLLSRYQSPENNYFFSPEWLNNDEVAAVELAADGKQIVNINFDNPNSVRLVKMNLGDIKHLRSSGNYLYFIATHSGKNSLYRFEMETEAIERVYEPRFGVESPAVSPVGNRIAISDYTTDGFRLIEIPAFNDSVTDIEKISQYKYQLADILSEQEAGYPVFSDTDNEHFQVEPYKKASNLFNFHSWGPIYIDVGSYEFSPGVSLMSQNVLGTSETILGYQWDLTERTGKSIAKYTYSGWYPVIDVDGTWGQRASHYNLISPVKDESGVMRQDTSLSRFTWNETSAGLQMKVPLSFDKGPYNRLLQPEVQYRYNHFKHNESTPEKFHQGSFHSLAYRFYFHQLRRSSHLDMYPDFGFIADAVYRHSPSGAIKAGDMKAFQFIAYFPGIMKNHGIRLYTGAQQKEDRGTMGFGDVIRYPRGWGRLATTSMATGGLDYKLPLLYPDWPIWKLIYTKRISASLFSDVSRLNGNYYSNGTVSGTWTKDITSVGTELTADINVIRFYAPATVGFRASWLPELKNVYFDLLLSINFDSF